MQKRYTHLLVHTLIIAHSCPIFNAFAWRGGALNPKEPLKEALQFFYDSALFLCAVSAAEAGCGRHQFVNIGAGRLDLTVAEGVIDKFARLALVQLFIGNDGGQLFFLFLRHIAVPFGQHIFHVVDAGNEGLDQRLFTAQFRAGINGFLNRDQNLFVCPVCTIDVARHIEKNTPFVGNVAYSQREFSYDNSLMELVRHTIEFIKRKPYGNKLLIKVKDEVKLVIDATPGYEPYDQQKIIEQNKENTVRHAYFREYLALQRLCLLILQHQKHQIGTGSRQIYGILFDGAWLWEEYINSLIKETFYHPMNKNGAGAQRLFDRNVGLIYPDFISRNSETRIIADAKYKPVDNIGNRDYLQVLAYMFRFDAKTGYYLYPEADGADDLKLQLNRGLTYEKNVMARDDISVIKHGLKIPIDAQNYSEFTAKMKVQEQEFTSEFYA